MGAKRSDDVSVGNADQRALQVNESTVGDPEGTTVVSAEGLTRGATSRRTVTTNHYRSTRTRSQTPATLLNSASSKLNR